MKKTTSLLAGLALATFSAGCGGAEEPTGSAAPPDAEAAQQEDHHDDHAHDEVSLGTARIGELDVELSQGHGPVVAGGESHLVVKLPYSDRGSTVVRAWIGTADRLRSYVGKGEYAPSHDDYDVHATAPDPLPPDAAWWVELEKPDGTRLVGSARPHLE